MRLLLAIEPDTRQASLIAALAKDSLGAELVVASSAGDALAALGDRIPDLILTSQLLSPRDEGVLTDRLRELDAAGIRVRTLVIPVLAEPANEPEQRNGLLARLGWRRPKASGPDGCDPAVFAGQIAEYLKRAATDRLFAHLPESRIPIEDATANVFAPPPASSLPIEDATANVFAHLPASSLPAEDPKPSVSDEEPMRVQPSGSPLEGLFSDDDLEGDSTEESASVFEDAVRAELAAMFAAVPLRAPEFTRTPETESPSEPRPAPFAVRSDLLEILAAIQRDLEPLRIDKSKTMKKASGAVQDEWGFFDPNQCGIAALVARLEHSAESRNAASQRSA